MKLGAAIGVLLALAGCGGDGKVCEENILVVVNVTDPEGTAIPDVTVTLDELPCTDTGDGISFECVAPEVGDYNVYALATSFEPYGQLVTVEAPADCETPALTQDVMLQRESAV
jgi:hypothetical protein